VTAIGEEGTQPGQLPLAGLRPHMQAAEVPPLPEAEHETLRKDIETRGVLTPIEISPDGLVLDGRARLRAARELGHEVIGVKVVTPQDELEHILRAALHRRHLDASQRAALALKLVEVEAVRAAAQRRQRANLRRGAEVATLPARSAEGRTRDRIAEVAGVSPRTAQDAITVFEHDPAIFERVMRGEVSANRAASKVRRAQRDANIPPAPPLPTGPFPLILADPPWPSASPDSGSAPEQHYPTMSIAELEELQLPAADDCVLFLWIVDWAFAGAVKLLDAWGFRHKSSLVWVKPSIGPGVWVRHRHETCWIAVKGNPGPPEPEDRCDSVLEAPRGRHSEKPEELYRLIERMYPHLAKLELFARGAPRHGWSCWGNQAEPAVDVESEGRAK
jgi:N6-adenosine-specific RNA methylase IME4